MSWITKLSIVLASFFSGLSGLSATPNVVIIGAGIGGSACAHFLKKEIPDAKITVLEAGTNVGGRILKDVIYRNISVQLGAGLYNADQRLVAQLARELGLAVVTFPGNGSFPETFVWDGASLVGSRGILGAEPEAEPELQRRLDDYLTAVRANYGALEEPTETFDSVPAYLAVGGLNAYAGQTGSEYFSSGESPLSSRVQADVVEVIIREFFGQGLEGHAVLGMTCLEGVMQDAFQVKGGMINLVTALLASSGADLRLNSRVSRIKKTPTLGQYVVYYEDSVGGEVKVEATAVVIAAPLEWTGIQFEGFNPNPLTSQPVRQWQQLYKYVSYVAAQSINSSYFGNQWTTNGTDEPLPLFTPSNTTGVIPWVSIRWYGLSGGLNVYLLKSSVNVSHYLLADLFVGLDEEIVSKRWEYLYTPNPPITGPDDYQTILLDTSVYNLNAMETVSSQMEMSVISARNAARLLAKDVTSGSATGVMLLSELRLLFCLMSLFLMVTLDV